MTPREQARAVSVALYGDAGEGFESDWRRYASGFGTALDGPLAFVLAHVVRSDWSLERMREDEDKSGDCWFIWLAAGSLPEIFAGLAAVRVTNLVAFERGNHPFMLRTRRFLFHGEQKQRASREHPEAKPSRAEACGEVSGEVSDDSAKATGEGVEAGGD